MKDYEGAIGSGADYPDKAIARKAAADVLAGRAEDKEAGLAQGKKASFGGLGRLFQGNIDAPGSEASDKYGAGAGATMRTPAAPPRPREGMGNRNMEGFDVPTPAPVTAPVTASAAEVEMPTPRPREAMGSMKGMPGRVVSKAELAKSGMSLRDFLNKERGLKKRPDATSRVLNTRSLEGSGPDYTPNKYPGQGRAVNPLDDQPLKKGGSIKAYAKGGSVSSRADGCAQRGKTRGMMR
jgi:hypothetical protein